MQLLDLIPDGEIFCALEPEELGLRMLPLLARWTETHRSQPLTLDNLIVTAIGDHRGFGNQYPDKNRDDVEIAIREAWAWLEGQALLIEYPRHIEPNHRTLSRRAGKLASEPDARRVSTVAALLKKHYTR